MSDYRRRRFLTDLLFVGGALLAAAGLATVAESKEELKATPVACDTPAPAETVCPTTPEPLNQPDLPKPGGRVAQPPVKPRPTRDPFQGPKVENYPMVGAMPAYIPPQKPQGHSKPPAK
ncbi:hypothetical protein IV102_37520 [bacterium]|nr:hypothetical protein [bacterium]